MQYSTYYIMVNNSHIILELHTIIKYCNILSNTVFIYGLIDKIVNVYFIE
jgi:hypothetical protein